MKAIPFALLFLSSIVVADTTVYQCEMSVADVKNGALTDVIKAPYGAMVVDSGDQFYVVRDDRVLSSPYLTNRNGKLTGVGEDHFTYNKYQGFYGIHASTKSYLFDDCKEIG
jgi:hypothetical protein